MPGGDRHRQVKYLDNVIEADHGKLKRLIRPVRGFKTLRTAYANRVTDAASRGDSRISETVIRGGGEKEVRDGGGSWTSR